MNTFSEWLNTRDSNYLSTKNNKLINVMLEQQPQSNSGFGGGFGGAAFPDSEQPSTGFPQQQIPAQKQVPAQQQAPSQQQAPKISTIDKLKQMLQNRQGGAQKPSTQGFGDYMKKTTFESVEEILKKSDNTNVSNASLNTYLRRFGGDPSKLNANDVYHFIQGVKERKFDEKTFLSSNVAKKLLTRKDLDPQTKNAIAQVSGIESYAFGDEEKLKHNYQVDLNQMGPNASSEQIEQWIKSVGGIQNIGGNNLISLAFGIAGGKFKQNLLSAEQLENAIDADTQNKMLTLGQKRLLEELMRSQFKLTDEVLNDASLMDLSYYLQNSPLYNKAIARKTFLMGGLENLEVDDINRLTNGFRFKTLKKEDFPDAEDAYDLIRNKELNKTKKDALQKYIDEINKSDVPPAQKKQQQQQSPNK